MATFEFDRRLRAAEALEEKLKGEDRPFDREVVRQLRMSAVRTRTTLKTTVQENKDLRERITALEARVEG